MVAIPFLLDLLRLPADVFELFVTIDVFSGRFGTLVAAMHVWVLALLGTCAIGGHLTWRWGRFIGFVGVSILLTLVTLGATRTFFTYAFDPEYTKYKAFVEMDLQHEPVTSKVLDALPAPVAMNASDTSRLQFIQQRGRLRVCFQKDSLPFAFRNAAGKLVGF